MSSRATPHLTRCRVCKCTEEEACNPPCGWATGGGNLCTTCADAIRALFEWRGAAHHPHVTALLREFKFVQTAMRRKRASA
jgi:hypothetical protein